MPQSYGSDRLLSRISPSLFLEKAMTWFPSSWIERPRATPVCQVFFPRGSQYFRWIGTIVTECYSAAMKICDKCRGTMLPERAVDLDAGLAITVFACLNCGRRKAADQEPRPLTARH